MSGFPHDYFLRHGVKALSEDSNMLVINSLGAWRLLGDFNCVPIFSQVALLLFSLDLLTDVFSPGKASGLPVLRIPILKIKGPLPFGYFTLTAVRWV